MISILQQLIYSPGSAKFLSGSSPITHPLWARKWHILSGWWSSCISCSKVMSSYMKVKYLRPRGENDTQSPIHTWKEMNLLCCQGYELESERKLNGQARRRDKRVCLSADSVVLQLILWHRFAPRLFHQHGWSTNDRGGVDVVRCCAVHDERTATLKCYQVEVTGSYRSCYEKFNLVLETMEPVEHSC